MTETPAEELRTAAAKLREMAEGTTRGPWFVADCDLYPRWMLSEGQTERDSRYAADVAKSYPDGGGDGVYVTDADWAWMAFANPAWAEPLAALLDVAAITWDLVGPGRAPSGATGMALAVARAILGGVRAQ
ncbi:hypothetical protein FLW53_23355 [Microbispora sp. SCL1-1]|uniref:hypothetical protein n=1 Tax=unclassified Microbispora TaxID=2614687 RepID=UPI00115AD503|nr:MULTISPECIES: hypothetical protein [unclassified Microbispora]NJP27082.1 hypothetical protein [Microbispora sp. CL1-1]TQS11428.1 hypothetical protein FLW53_23355 [Microbispora sp. SCL1-1]